MAFGPKYAEAVTAFNRFGLGARPGDLEAADHDPRGFLLEELWTANVALIRNSAPPSSLKAFEAYYLDQQQRVARMKATTAPTPPIQTSPTPATQAALSTTPAAAMARGASTPTSAKAEASVSQMATVAPPAAAAASGAFSEATTAKPGAPKPPSAEQILFRAEADARQRKQLHARVGFVERLVAFWSNHFAVSVAKSNELRVCRRAVRARSDPAQRARQVLRFAACGREPSGNDPLPRQSEFHRPRCDAGKIRRQGPQ